MAGSTLDHAAVRRCGPAHTARRRCSERAAPSTAQAIADVVKAAGHLLDRCRPSSSATSVAGVIEPPSGSAPLMHVRFPPCGRALGRRHGGGRARRPSRRTRQTALRPGHDADRASNRRSNRVGVRSDLRRGVGGRGQRAGHHKAIKRHGAGLGLDRQPLGKSWRSRCGGDLGTGEGSPNVTVEFISVCPS